MIGLRSGTLSVESGRFRSQIPGGHVRQGARAKIVFKFGPGFPERRSRLLSVEFGKFPDGELMSLALARGERITAKFVVSAALPPRLVLAAICSLLLMAATAAADDHNPFAGDPKAAQAGEYEFRINCALCHGLGARGGGRGPDLTRAQKKHAHSDAELFQVISNGIPGTVMPANGTNGQGVGMTDEEIWQIITYIRSVEVKTAASPRGSAAHGRELFYGEANCSLCHMVEGRGGRLGPELTAVGGSRTRAAMIDSVRNPSRRLAWGLTEATKEFPQEYETITVVTADGKKIKGVARNEDNFSVQMIDASEQIYLLEKDKLRSFQKSRESMMPTYTRELLSDQDLDDIVAYLISLGAK
jgi:cytochrome c oxidase cbb3-type subunit 3